MILHRPADLDLQPVIGRAANGGIVLRDGTKLRVWQKQ